jgi:hypothetical protein
MDRTRPTFAIEVLLGAAPGDGIMPVVVARGGNALPGREN